MTSEAKDLNLNYLTIKPKQTMNNYIVAILSFFENEIKQFRICAESEYEALKLGLIEFSVEKKNKQDELDYQNTTDYPKTKEELINQYINSEIALSVIKI